MKIIKKSKNTNILLIIIAAIIILLLMVLLLEKTGTTHLFNVFSISDNKSDEQKESEINTANKQKLIESTTKDSGSSTDQNTYQNHSQSDISLSTKRETNDSITIQTQLTNYSDGTCELSITNNDQIIKKSAPVIYQPSFSTCAGFNIPIDLVGYGIWQISLRVTSKDKTNMNSISVEIK